MSNARPKAGVKLRDDEKVKHIPVTIIPTEKEEMLRKPEWIKIKLPRNKNPAPDAPAPVGSNSTV